MAALLAALFAWALATLAVAAAWEIAALETDALFNDFVSGWRATRPLNSRSRDDTSETVDFLRYVSQYADGRPLNTALWKLSELLLEHPHLQRHASESSWDLLVRAADEGNEHAQHRLAAAYGTGLYGGMLVPMDAGRALWLEHMAALSGLPEAAMAMGNRFMFGIGVAANCERALPLFEYAAHIAADAIERTGLAPAVDALKLPDSTNDATQDWTDYYLSLAVDGDGSAAAALGNLYAKGSRTVQQNETKAILYMQRAHQLGNLHIGAPLGYLMLRRMQRFQRWGREEDRDAGGDVALALALLRQEPKKTPSGFSLVGLAFAHIHGLGVTPNVTHAMGLLQKALPLHPDAGLLLGDLLMQARDLQDLPSAVQAYSTAAKMGHVLAVHRLGVLMARGQGHGDGQRSCDTAASHLKYVAERGGPWAKRLSDAHALAENGHPTRALDLFSRLAAEGYAAAQFNAAHLLSGTRCPQTSLPMPQATNASSAAQLPAALFEVLLAAPPSPREPGNQTDLSRKSEQMRRRRRSDCDLRAVALYALSAGQGDADSIVLLGDSYYYGRAVLPVTRSRAASLYKLAADRKQTQAMFNLGLMHEAGDGVEQDFHLAKRFFDQAAEVDSRAHLPREIALLLLHGRKMLHAWLESDALSPEVAAQLRQRIGEGLHLLRSADELLHTWLDEATVWYYTMQRRLKTRGMTKLHALLLQVQQVQQKFLEEVDAWADGKPVRVQLTAAEEFELLILLLILFILLLFVRFYT